LHLLLRILVTRLFWQIRQNDS